MARDCPICESVLVPDPEIEQMLRWLCRHANHFTFITSNNDVRIYSAWSRGGGAKEPILLGKGPTLREAMRAACAWEKANQERP